MEDAVTHLMQVAKELLAKDRRVHFEQGHYFNLIEIADLVYDENFHSDFIATLLDPKGKHGQGAIFLRCFFECLKGLHPNPNLPEPDDQWTVEREKLECVHSGDLEGRIGRTDISLERDKFRLIIENKIDASDQPSQIARYAKCAEERGFDWALLYLTIHGERPANHSMTGIGEEDEPKVFLIDYRVFIQQWINMCLKQVGAIHRVREMLTMYAQTISCLAGDSTENKAASEMGEYINCSNDFRAAKLIHDAYEEKQSEITKQFMEKIKAQMEARLLSGMPSFDSKDVSDSSSIENFRDYGHAFRLPLSHIFPGIDFRFCILIDPKGSLYYGWLHMIDGRPTEHWGADYPLLHEAVRSLQAPPICAHLAGATEDYPGWINPRKALNFHAIAENFITLADKAVLDTVSESYADEAYSLVMAFMEALHTD